MESHRGRKQCFWTDNWWDVCASVFIQGAGTQKRAGPRTSWNAKNWLWAIKSLLTDALGNGLRPTQTIFNNGPSGRSETSLDWALKPLLGKKKKKTFAHFRDAFPMQLLAEHLQHRQSCFMWQLVCWKRAKEFTSSSPATNSWHRNKSGRKEKTHKARDREAKWMMVIRQW